MMNKFRNLFLFLAILVATGSAFSQSFNYQHDPLIDIKVTFEDSSVVELSWNTPSGATACTLEYKTLFDTTLHIISNFTLDSISLSRSTPISAIEHFTIYFSKANGKGVYDDGPGGIYGGVIIVEDDVWATPVGQVCDNGTFDEYLFGITSGNWSIAAAVPHVCDLREQLLIAKPNMPMAELTTLLLNELQEHLDNGSYPEAVFPYDVIYYYENHINWDEYTQRMAGSNVPLRRNFALAPNPAEQFVVLKPTAQVAHGVLKVSVIDPTGRVIYKRHQHFDESQTDLRIDMLDWNPGLYFVQIDNGVHRESIKLIKQ